MLSLTRIIERYLDRLLDDMGGSVKVRRNDLSKLFNCSGRQIRYVLDSRFTPERGYLVQSQRGCRGGIEIHRVGRGDAVEVADKIAGILDEELGIPRQNSMEPLVELIRGLSPASPDESP